MYFIIKRREYCPQTVLTVFTRKEKGGFNYRHDKNIGADGRINIIGSYENLHRDI